MRLRCMLPMVLSVVVLATLPIAPAGADVVRPWRYWLTWYDGVHQPADWLVIANHTADTADVDLRFGASAGSGASSQLETVGPGALLTRQFPGYRGGAVEVRSTGPLQVSIRSLWGSGPNRNFEEVDATPAFRAENVHAWPWYDGRNTQGRDWIHVVNTYFDQTTVTLEIAGVVVGSAIVAPGRNWNWSDRSVQGGPVVLRATAPVVASQRVLWDSVNFSETPSIEPSRDSWFSWYDDRSSSGDWVVVANTGSKAADVRVSVAGGPAVTKRVAAGGTWPARFRGVVGGPVHVTSSADVVVSRRTIWNGWSMEEVGGHGSSSGGRSTYYDAIGSDGREWLLVANVGASAVPVSIAIDGETVYSSVVHPGSVITPVLAGERGGPVSVTGPAGSRLLVTRRTLWGPRADFTELPTSPHPSWAAPPAGARAFHGGVAHAGRGVGPSLPAALAWSRDFGSPVSYPIVDGGRVFVLVGSRGHAAQPPDPTDLYALDLATGQTIWGPVRVTTDPGVPGLAYDDGVVVVPEPITGAGGYSAATGAKIWTTDLDGASDLTAPVAAHGVVLVGGHTVGGALWGLDVRSGRRLWQIHELSGGGSATLADDGAYLSGGCDFVYRVDPATGHLEWSSGRTGCVGGGGTVTAVHGGRAFVRTTGGEGRIISRTDGTTLGTFNSVVPPAVGDDLLYVRTDADGLQALVTPTSVAAWTFKPALRTLCSAPVLSGSVVYVGACDGGLWALDATTGAILWSGEADATLWGPDGYGIASWNQDLTLAEGYLLVPASERLVAFVAS